MRHKLFLRSDDINLYEDAFAVYSLRDVFGWTNGVIQLRRTSDNVTTSVFFDSNGEISLNSFIGDETTPTTTTLGTWIGSNSATVRRWYKMTADNISTNQYLSALSVIIQPLFINSGVINTKNGKPTINFDGVDDGFTLNTGSFSELDSGNDFTIISVSYNNVVGSGAIVSNTNSVSPNDYRISTFNDRRINKVSAIVNTLSGVTRSNTINQNNTSNQKLSTNIYTGLNTLSSYYNNVFQDFDVYSDTYRNDSFLVGQQRNSASLLNGGIQEIIMYPSDKTTELNEIHTNINNYYNIY